jgi:hypothetical protein
VLRTPARLNGALGPTVEFWREPLKSLSLVLRLVSLVFFGVAAVHLILGLGADQLLGAVVPAEALTEPSLDSQNRFYGVSFAFYGLAFYICAGDLKRFRPILEAAFLVFFLAGCARLVSWALHGAPAALVTALLAAELALPPLLYAWLRSALQSDA